VDFLERDEIVPLVERNRAPELQKKRNESLFSGHVIITI
jgi:hypothetical protein